MSDDRTDADIAADAAERLKDEVIMPLVASLHGQGVAGIVIAGGLCMALTDVLGMLLQAQTTDEHREVIRQVAAGFGEQLLEPFQPESMN